MRKSGSERDGLMTLTRYTVTQLAVVALLVGPSSAMAASARGRYMEHWEQQTERLEKSVRAPGEHVRRR